MRIKKNWPQERLAEECGLSIRNVSVIEAGRSDLRFSSLLRLAEAREVPFAQLVAEPKRLEVPAMKPGEAKARERQKGRD